MFIRTSICLSCLGWLSCVLAQPLYQPLGEAAADLSQLPAWNLSISPDGQGLPDGSGNAAQGKRLFERHCVTCHGFGAIGGSAMPLVGDVGSLTSDYPEKNRQ